MSPDELIHRPGLLKGHRIRVTGGGTGLGRVMAEAYGMLGATVYICGRRMSVLRDAADALNGEHGAQVVPLACDIRRHEDIAELRALDRLERRGLGPGPHGDR